MLHATINYFWMAHILFFCNSTSINLQKAVTSGSVTCAFFRWVCLSYAFLIQLYMLHMLTHFFHVCTHKKKNVLYNNMLKQLFKLIL